MSSVISAGTSTGSALNMSGDTSGALALATNNGTTAVTIDTSQRVLVNTTTARTAFFNSTNTPLVQIEGTTFNTASESIVRNSADTAAPFLILGKTRGTTVGSTSAVALADQLGSVSFQGSDGTELVEGARIVALIDATPGANDMPTALAFNTTADSASGSTERMRIDSSGNVGIGTNSPTQKISVLGASTESAYISLRANNNASTSEFLLGQAGSTDACYVFNRANGVIVFGTNNVERGRFTATGDLLVGAASWSSSSNSISIGGSSNSRILITNSTDYGLELYGATSSRVSFASSNGSATRVGSITVSTSATTYGTSSDYRLKENIVPMTGALDTVQQLKPVTYKWKIDGSSGQGFIAHELQEVVPDAVTGEKDAVDADGNPDYQGIDTSFLVATLTAAIQELKQIVDTQATEIAALKAKVGA